MIMEKFNNLTLLPILKQKFNKLERNKKLLKRKIIMPFLELLRQLHKTKLKKLTKNSPLNTIPIETVQNQMLKKIKLQKNSKILLKPMEFYLIRTKERNMTLANQTLMVLVASIWMIKLLVWEAWVEWMVWEECLAAHSKCQVIWEEWMEETWTQVKY